MRYPNTIEDLLRLDLSVIRKNLKSGGYSFSKLDEILTPGSTCSSSLSWSKTNYLGETRKVGELRYRIGKDSEGLYLELDYIIQRGNKGTPRTQRYYLVRRESNLKPGTYRYYILDPYSEEQVRLCSKLYCLEGCFYPRSALSPFKIYYKQQREGHTARYVWSFYHRIPEASKMRYRKSHYRGKETPVWRRYTYLYEEGNRRATDYLIRRLGSRAISEGYTDLLYSRGL